MLERYLFVLTDQQHNASPPTYNANRLTTTQLKESPKKNHVNHPDHINLRLIIKSHRFIINQRYLYRLLPLLIRRLLAPFA